MSVWARSFHVCTLGRASAHCLASHCLSIQQELWENVWKKQLGCLICRKKNICSCSILLSQPVFDWRTYQGLPQSSSTISCVTVWGSVETTIQSTMTYCHALICSCTAGSELNAHNWSALPLISRPVCMLNNYFHAPGSSPAKKACLRFFGTPWKFLLFFFFVVIFSTAFPPTEKPQQWKCNVYSARTHTQWYIQANKVLECSFEGWSYKLFLCFLHTRFTTMCSRGGGCACVHVWWRCSYTKWLV